MPDSDINVVITRLGLLSDDVGELKETLRQIATAVTRLAFVEERQSQTNEALGRAFKQIDKVELKLTGIEQRLVSLERVQAQAEQMAQGAQAARNLAAADTRGQNALTDVMQAFSGYTT